MCNVQCTVCSVQCAMYQCTMCSVQCAVRAAVTSELSPQPGDWFVACAATAAAAPPAPPAAAPVAAPPAAAPPSLQAAAQLHLISQSSAGRHAVPLAPSLPSFQGEGVPPAPVRPCFSPFILAPFAAPGCPLESWERGSVCAVSRVGSAVPAPRGAGAGGRGRAEGIKEHT